MKKQTKKYRDKNSRTIGFFYFLRCGNLTNTLSSCKSGIRRFHPGTGPGRPGCSNATVVKKVNL